MARLSEHHATIWLDWEPVSKRWKLTWHVRVGRTGATHWRWVQSTAAVDTLRMHELADDIARRLEAALF